MWVHLTPLTDSEESEIWKMANWLQRVLHPAEIFTHIFAILRTLSHRPTVTIRKIRKSLFMKIIDIDSLWIFCSQDKTFIWLPKRKYSFSGKNKYLIHSNMAGKYYPSCHQAFHMYLYLHEQTDYMCKYIQKIYPFAWPLSTCMYLTKQFILYVHLHVDTLFAFFDTMVIQWYVVIHTVGT